MTRKPFRADDVRKTSTCLVPQSDASRRGSTHACTRAVLAGGHARHFNDFVIRANKTLKNGYGMELVPMRHKEGAAGKGPSLGSVSGLATDTSRQPHRSRTRCARHSRSSSSRPSPRRTTNSYPHRRSSRTPRRTTRTASPCTSSAPRRATRGTSSARKAARTASSVSFSALYSSPARLSEKVRPIRHFTVLNPRTRLTRRPPQTSSSYTSKSSV